MLRLTETIAQSQKQKTSAFFDFVLDNDKIEKFTEAIGFAGAYVLLN
jgi:hypothetical protein